MNYLALLMLARAHIQKSRNSNLYQKRRTRT